MKVGGFDVSLFFRDIVSPPEDESELGLQLEPCDKVEDLQKRVRAKEQKKRALARLIKMIFIAVTLAVSLFSCVFTYHLCYLTYFSAVFRLSLCLGGDLNVTVGLYATAVQARKPAPVRLYRETNEPVHSKTRTFHTQTGSLLLPSEIKKAQVIYIYKKMFKICQELSCTSQTLFICCRYMARNK